MNSSHSLYLWITEDLDEKIQEVSEGLVIQLFKAG